MTQNPTSPGSVLTEADVAAGWKLHDGGPNPVPGQMICWRARDGRESECPADELFGWRHDGSCSDHDIIACRLSRPQPVSGSEGEGVEARMQSVIRMLEKVTGPTDSVRIYAHEAKLILAEIKAIKEGSDIACDRSYFDGLRAGYQMGERGEVERYEAVKAGRLKGISEARTLTQGGTGQ